MKNLLLLLLLSASAVAGDFVRELPPKDLLEQLTPNKFTGKDAVVIVKEVSYNCEQKEIYYSGLPFNGLSTTISRVTIAKLFNEAAVARYGTVEFTYVDPYGKAFTSDYRLNVRVLKPDGSIEVMDDDEVHNVVLLEDADGDPYIHKVLCKIPHLSVNDVVQIEYAYSQLFRFGASEIFAYNEEDPILYSNLYITLPRAISADFYSYPKERIGDPQIQQISNSLGAGKTYFWSVKNLNGIRPEPFSIPFMDQALITALVITSRSVGGSSSAEGWPMLGKQFSEFYLKKDDLKESQFKSLGFSQNQEGITMATADSLYTAIRRTFSLSQYGDIFPESMRLSQLFDKKKGEASDLAYIMLSALRVWKQNVRAVLIRDRRHGQYERTVPTMEWFDRMGVMVTINGVEKVYDFDRSIPEQYVTPWFLRDIQVVTLSNDDLTHRTINPRTSEITGKAVEQHILSFDAPQILRDSMSLTLSGAPAQTARDHFTVLAEDELRDQLQVLATKECLKNAATMEHSSINAVDPIWLMYTGPSQSVVEQLDAFLTVRLRNHVLKEFHDKLFSTARRNDVQLDEPVTMTMEWTVRLPKGYVLSSTDGNRVFTGPAGSTGVVRRTPSADKLIVKAEVVCPQTFMPYNQYPALMKLLDDVQTEIGKDVVLKKL